LLIVRLFLSFVFCLLSFVFCLYLTPHTSHLLKRHISMLPRRHLHPLIIQSIQSRQNLFPCHRRINNFIYISALISNKRICNFISVLLY